MAGRLENKRCLIVGGTSGIGFAAAKRFLAEGARLLVAGLAMDEHDAELLTENGLIAWLACDARQAAEVDKLFAETSDRLGGLDVLYHAAGSSGRHAGDGPLHECTEEGWQATIDANLKSTFLTNRAAVRSFLKQGQPGALLNMASVLAIAPSPRYFDTFAYTASKGGIIAMSRQAAAHYAGARIRVNVIAPGLIDTPMASRAVQDASIREFLCSKQPLTNGAGQPDDCSEAAVFLCSDTAHFITGVVLPVDGGWCVSEGQYSLPK